MERMQIIKLSGGKRNVWGSIYVNNMPIVRDFDNNYKFSVTVVNQIRVVDIDLLKIPG